jgi:putative FmdB family regulatory protein
VPIYEYACMECEEHFEELVRTEQQVVTCPSCGAAKVLKQLSSFAVHGSGSSAKPSLASGAGGGGGCCGGGCGCGH